MGILVSWVTLSSGSPPPPLPPLCASCPTQMTSRAHHMPVKTRTLSLALRAAVVLPAGDPPLRKHVLCVKETCDRGGNLPNLCQLSFPIVSLGVFFGWGGVGGHLAGGRLGLANPPWLFFLFVFSKAEKWHNKQNGLRMDSLAGVWIGTVCVCVSGWEGLCLKSESWSLSSPSHSQVFNCSQQLWILLSPSIPHSADPSASETSWAPFTTLCQCVCVCVCVSASALRQRKGVFARACLSVASVFVGGDHQNRTRKL